MAKPSLSTVPEPDAEKESTVRQRLIGQSMIVLRERHREEFDEIAGEAFAKAGLVYTRRLTPQERAADRIRALAAEAGLVVQFGEPEQD